MTYKFSPDKVYAVYYRNSTLDQQHSLKGQGIELNAFAKKQGIEIGHRYYDEGKTGTNMNRNGLKQLLADASQKKFQVLLVWRLDRIARNVEDFYSMMQVFRKNHVTVYSVKEKLLYKREELLHVFLKSYEASNFSIKLREDTIRGINLAINEGRHSGGLAPYGYDVDRDTKKYLVNKAEAKVVKKIYKLCAEGVSSKDIIIGLNKQGVRNKAGNTWKYGNLSLLLRSQKYLGMMVYGRTTNKDEFENSVRNLKVPDDKIFKKAGLLPQIISQELFDRVQLRLNKGGSHTSSRCYVLSGFLKCKNCSKNLHGMTRSSGRSKNPYISYICSNKKAKKCSIKEVEATKTERAVIRAILPLLFNKKINKITELVNQEVSNNSEMKERKSALNLELKKAQVRRENFLEAIGKGVSPELMNEKIQDADIAIRKIHDEINRFKAHKSVTKKTVRRVFERLLNSQEERILKILKQLFGTIVEAITVDNEKLEVIVNINAGKKACKSLGIKVNKFCK